MSPLLRRSALALLCLGWLSACQILPTEITPPTTYALTLSAPAPVTAPVLPAVRLGTTTVGAPWNGTALVYQLSDVRFSADAYHRLLSPASTLLNTALADWLGARQRFEAVLAPGSPAPAPWRLETGITALYGDFRSASAPQAVISAQFVIVDTAAVPRRRLLVLDLNQRIPLESATAAALVAGYRQGWLRMLEELDARLANLKPDNTSAGHS